MYLFFILCMQFFAQSFAQPSMSQGSYQTNVFIPRNPSPTQQWHVVSTVYVDVHYAYKDRHVAQHLARHAQRSIPRIAQTLDIGAGSAMKIYIMPDQKSFDRLQPGKTPDWADGTAWPDLGLIFLRSPDIRDGRSDPLTQVLDHEIAHIVLGRAFGDRPVPRWLQEGVAQLVAGEHTHRSIDTLSQGVLGDSLLSLHELTHRFPKDPNRAHLAYAQSADFIIFLQQNYGSNTLKRLIAFMIQNHSFRDSIRNVTGKSIDDLDLEWRGELSSSWLWLKPLVSDTALLSFGGLMLLVGFLRTLRNRGQVSEKLLERRALYEALDKELRHWQPSYLQSKNNIPW